jgi:hypothetical protein
MRRLWLAAALVLSGCDSKAAGPPTRATGPAPELPALPSLVLTRNNMMDTQAYEKIPAPPTAPLRWDLAAKAKHVLALKQTISIKESSVPVGVPPVYLEGYTQAEGIFVVEGRATNEPGSARIRLAIVRQEVQGSVLPDDVIKKMDASACEYAVSADGALTKARKISGNAPQLIEVVFGLPAKPLAEGESAESLLDVTAAVDSYGYRGRTTTTLTGWHRIGRRECARLETTFDVELLMPPRTISKGRLRGRVISYFCAAEGRFVQVEADTAYSQRSVVQKSREADPNGAPVWGIDGFDAEALLSARLQ